MAALLIEDPSLRISLTEQIATSEHPAVYWETPPVSSRTTERPFEMVVLPARRLALIEADPRAFAEHLKSSADPVCTFPNLRGDARLIVPRMLDPQATHGHLVAFLRGAPKQQIHALWQRLGQAVDAWWSTKEAPVWVSTAGDGVPWLHVRLDSRPKYYKHRPYLAHEP